MVGGTVKDWNPKKISLGHSARRPLKTDPIAGSGMSASFLPSSPTASVPKSHCARIAPAVCRRRRSRLQHGVRLRDNFFPVLALGVGRIGDKHAVVGRIFVGGE